MKHSKGNNKGCYRPRHSRVADKNPIKPQFNDVRNKFPLQTVMEEKAILPDYTRAWGFLDTL